MAGKVWYDKKQKVWRLFFPPGIYRQSRHDKEGLERFLNYLRVERDKKTFDPRDYQTDSPLRFDYLAEEWLSNRKGQVRCYRVLRLHIRRAISYFVDTNFRRIRYGQLDDYLREALSGLSAKSKKNHLATLHAFFQTTVDRYEDDPMPLRMPKFPKIEVEEPQFRKILDPPDRAKIFHKLVEIAPDPKVPLAILWLLTYGLRPGELKNMTMNNVDSYGWLSIHNWKGKRIRRIKLLKEDYETFKRDQAIGGVPFWRHPDGTPHGEHFWYRWWKKASQNLGFEVDLYGSTRHSSATALSPEYTPEQIRAYFLDHTTSKVLYRYLQPGEDVKQEMYAKMRAELLEIRDERTKEINK